MLILDSKGLEVLQDLSMFVRICVPLGEASTQDDQSDTTSPSIGVAILGMLVHMVEIGPTMDPGGTILSVHVSQVLLGYTDMSTSSDVSTSIAHAAFTSVDVGVGIGLCPRGCSSPRVFTTMYNMPLPLPPNNPVLNTILQNIG